MATESAESAFSPSGETEEDEEAETTLYFDAEEGTLRTEDGTAISLDIDEESTNDEDEDEEQEEGEENGTQTPQAAEQPRQQPQTITSMSTMVYRNDTRIKKRALLLHCARSVLRCVSSPIYYVHVLIDLAAGQ